MVEQQSVEMKAGKPTEALSKDVQENKGLVSRMRGTQRKLEKKKVKFTLPTGEKGVGDGTFPDIYLFINFQAVMVSLIFAGIAWGLATVAGWLSYALGPGAQTQAWMAFCVSLGYLVLNCVKIEGRPDLERLRKILSFIFLGLAVILLINALLGLFKVGGDGPVWKAIKILGSALGAVGGAIVAVGSFIGSVADDVGNILTGDEDGDGIKNFLDGDYWGNRLYNEDPSQLGAIRTGWTEATTIPFGNGYITLAPFGGIGWVGGSLLGMRAVYKASVKNLGILNLAKISKKLEALKVNRLDNFKAILKANGIDPSSAKGVELTNKYSKWLDKQISETLYRHRKQWTKTAEVVGERFKRIRGAGAKGKRFVNLVAQRPKMVKSLNDASEASLDMTNDAIKRINKKDVRVIESLLQKETIKGATGLSEVAGAKSALVGVTTLAGTDVVKVDNLNSLGKVKGLKGGEALAVSGRRGTAILEMNEGQTIKIADKLGNQIDLVKRGDNLVAVAGNKSAWNALESTVLLKDGKHLARVGDMADEDLFKLAGSKPAVKQMDAFQIGDIKTSKAGMNALDLEAFKPKALKYNLEDVGTLAKRVGYIPDIDVKGVYKGLGAIGELSDVGKKASIVADIAQVAKTAPNRRSRRRRRRW